jgi:hypothetical protein
MAPVHLDQAFANKMVNEALHTYADARFHGNVEQTLQEIQQGNCEVCGSVSTCLASQLAAYLGQVDPTVRAVFRYEPDYAAPRQLPGREPVPLRKGGINLVAWVSRKSATFQTLSSSLEKLLAEPRKKIDCRNAGNACYVIDLQAVEEKEVLEDRGLGLVVNSALIHTTPLWNRIGASGSAPVAPPETALNAALAHPSASSPEGAALDALFSEALAIEKLPPQEKRSLEPRLREMKVDLIRHMLSDQPRFLEVAGGCLTISDLVDVFHHRIGTGQIGGEAAGLVLAKRIVQNELHGLKTRVRIPESYYLGADLIYEFMTHNRLMDWNYQKYKSDEQIRSDYPLIQAAFAAGEFPPETLEKLEALLKHFAGKPLIVRSSSLLEDSFGSAFAGKYAFIICPNQGSPAENLKAFTQAIAGVYASTLCPEALLYRQIRGLRDYDERMGVLIQPVQGERFGSYYLPVAAGVALSQNLYRWAPQIRAEDGFVRMVWGLATSVVERASNNPPRLIALSGPTLQPSDSAHPEWSFCQKFVDVLDLKDNQFKTLPVHQVISPDYPTVRLIAQHKEFDYFTPLRGKVLQADIPHLAITFDDFLRKTDFAVTLTHILRTLEKYYQTPVDIGFTAQVIDPEEPQPEISFALLHCRRQDYLANAKPGPLPAGLTPEKVLFKTGFMVPRGHLTGIQHVLFISPEGYERLPDDATRNELRLAIYQLNTLLGEKKFICVGPGQWGAHNPRLGVYISYADVHNAAALVELYAQAQADPALGTYAFQDLMEAHIYPLTIHLNQPGAFLNRAFFYDSPNQIGDYLQPAPVLNDCMRLIAVANYAPGCQLEIRMDDEQSQAVAYFGAA